VVEKHWCRPLVYYYLVVYSFSTARLGQRDPGEAVDRRLGLLRLSQLHRLLRPLRRRDQHEVRRPWFTPMVSKKLGHFLNRAKNGLAYWYDCNGSNEIDFSRRGFLDKRGCIDATFKLKYEKEQEVCKKHRWKLIYFHIIWTKILVTLY